MNKLVVAAAFAATVGATPALAQEAPVLGGPRIEATVGFDRVMLHVDGDTGSKGGATYGGELGYDFPVAPTTVVGVYVGVDGSSVKDCEDDGTESACIKTGRNFTAGVRVGALVGARSLIYAKGGYSNGRIRFDYSDTAFPADDFSLRQDMDGFHVGVGVQQSFSGNVYGKLEYNYTRYSKIDDSLDARFDRHRLVVGIGVGF